MSESRRTSIFIEMIDLDVAKALVARAVAEERERAARVAENEVVTSYPNLYAVLAYRIAAGIRRGDS